MPPILGNAIVLLAVALLVTACARYLWKDARRGGCGGCAGCGRGDCAQCSACHAGTFQADKLPDLGALRLSPDKLRELRVKKGARP